METTKVRPILVESDITALTKPFSVGITLCNDKKLRIGNPVGESESRMELILIGLNPNEKIEVGDKVYEKNLNIEKSIYEVYKRNDKLGFFRFRNVFIPFEKQNSAKKVIAIQDQLSPEYIQQFIEEYNKGEVKDIEIELYKLGFDIKAEFPYNSSLPKLTNGFITIINKEPILYTEEDLKEAFGAGIEFESLCRRGFNKEALSFNKWFNQNKKK